MKIIDGITVVYYKIDSITVISNLVRPPPIQKSTLNIDTTIPYFQFHINKSEPCITFHEGTQGQSPTQTYY